jgi:hypothetical protein
MIIRRLLGSAAAAVVLLTATASIAAAGPSAHGLHGVAKLRAVTTKYHSLARAEHDQFGLLTDTAGISCIAEPGMGAMGYHYVNSARVGDPAIKLTRPEALLYSPDRHGRLHFAGVEYVVIKADWDATHASPPRLFGHEFNFSDAPNRFGLPPYYSLHVWAFKHNPAGMFEMWNPRVHCPMESMAPMGSM